MKFFTTPFAKQPRLAARSSVHLDLIRGISAVAVLLYHLRGLFFVDFPLLAKNSIVSTGLYAITGYGHQAVMVFFVLSGYFIGASVMNSVGEQQWSWRIYLANRLTRLQLVLFPALSLGAVWDQIGMRVPQAASLYYGGLYKFYGPSVALRSTLPVFFSNLFFLQSLLSPVFGSNGPLWSLSYEFWYYILFPACVLLTVASPGIRNRMACLGLTVFLLWFIGPHIALYFLIWLMGAFVSWRSQTAVLVSRRTQVVLSVGTGLIFFVVLAWNRTHRFSSDFVTDSLVGLSFALWLYTMVLGSRDDVSSAYAAVAKKFSGFSYTLYLTHFPALLLLRGLVDPKGSWQPDLQHLLDALGIALLMLIYAYVVAEFTEARTASVRHRLLQPRMRRAKEIAR